MNATPTFEYKTMTLTDLAVQTRYDDKKKRNIVENVTVGDEPCQPSNRFWSSLYSRFGFTGKFFKYYDHDEVFNRIRERRSNSEIRVCVEHGRVDENGRALSPILLASTNPIRPVILHRDVMDLLQKSGASVTSYHDGVIESTHPVDAQDIKLNNDVFKHQFNLQTPIDGYGLPNIYLSMMRQVCSNGMVAMAAAFRSSVNVGKTGDNPIYPLHRAMEGFSNDEGFAALRSRLESAGKSWASVYESLSLYDCLVNQYGTKNVAMNGGMAIPAGQGIVSFLQEARARDVEWRASSGVAESQGGAMTSMLSAFHRMTGDTSKLYGLANLDALSVKKQAVLPVRCTVMDLINFATEVSTHHSEPAGKRALDAWTGKVIGNPGGYDLEGTKTAGKDEFQDFFLDRKLAVPEVTGR